MTVLDAMQSLRVEYVAIYGENVLPRLNDFEDAVKRICNKNGIPMGSQLTEDQRVFLMSEMEKEGEHIWSLA